MSGDVSPKRVSNSQGLSVFTFLACIRFSVIRRLYLKGHSFMICLLLPGGGGWVRYMYFTNFWWGWATRTPQPSYTIPSSAEFCFPIKLNSSNPIHPLCSFRNHWAQHFLATYCINQRVWVALSVCKFKFANVIFLSVSSWLLWLVLAKIFNHQFFCLFPRKWYPFLDRSSPISEPYLRLNCLKTMPFTALHTYLLAHIRQYPSWPASLFWDFSLKHIISYFLDLFNRDKLWCWERYGCNFGKWRNLSTDWSKGHPIIMATIFYLFMTFA